MVGDLNYTVEKYRAAVESLAIGSGDLCARLLDAYLSQASHIVPILKGLGPPMSDQLASRIELLHAKFTASSDDVVTMAETAMSGGMAAAVHAMSDQEVRETALELVWICFDAVQEKARV